MAARRYTAGKLRKDLIPKELMDELAKVYTMGAEKYTTYNEDGTIADDGANNWRKGLSWKQTIGAMRRHLDKMEGGEDFDKDWPKELIDKYGPTYHLANVAWGCATLLNFYKNHPELDDREHKYLKPKRIGLDVDDVCAAWAQNWNRYHGNDVAPTSWYFDRAIMSKFDAMKGKELDDFYLGLPSLVNGKDIPFEPHCYVTSRPVSSEITEQWLDKHDFPAAPVITVGLGGSKIEALKEAKVDIFVDDNYANFVALNNAGVCTYLFDAPHNQRYNVGYKRIKSLKELI